MQAKRKLIEKTKVVDSGIEKEKELDLNEFASLSGVAASSLKEQRVVVPVGGLKE